MKITHLLTGIFVATMSNVAFSEITIDENLVQEMKLAGPNGTVSALVYLNDQVDIKELSDSITQANMRFQDRHQLVVVGTDPPQLLQAPRTERARSVAGLAAPHESPSSDAGAVVCWAAEFPVVEIWKPEAMAKFVGHDAHRLRTGARPHNVTMTAIAADADGGPVSSFVLGLKICLRLSQAGDPIGLAEDKALGRGAHEDKDVVHQTVLRRRRTRRTSAAEATRSRGTPTAHRRSRRAAGAPVPQRPAAASTAG